MITCAPAVLTRIHCDRCDFATKARLESLEEVLERARRNGWALGFDATGQPLHICRRCRHEHGHEVLPEPPTPTSIARANAAGGFTCPRCGRTSYHPVDAQEGYCGACHDWTAPPIGRKQ